jgi:apolipoprotein N-acyltransferase
MPASRTQPASPHRLPVTVGLAVAHAILMVVAYPAPGIWPAILVAPLPLAWLALRAPSTRRAMLVVLPVAWIKWLVLHAWMTDVTVAGTPSLALYLSVYDLLFVWGVRRVGLHPRWGALPMTVVVPVLQVGLEGLRGELVFHGYGWFLVAHPLVEWPVLVQSADLLGTYFVSLLAAAVAGALVDVLRDGVRTRRVAVACAVVVVVHAANLAYGARALAPAAEATPGPTVLAIQTNLPQSNKVRWSVEEQVRDVGGFFQLTETAFRETGGADLVIWPETMLPVHGLEPETIDLLRRWNQHAEVSFAEGIFALRDGLGAAVLVGAPSFHGLGVDTSDGSARWTWSAHHNSAYLLQDGAPLQRYDKKFLTPFGETMPYISAWPWLEARLLAIGASGMSFDLDPAPAITRPRLRWGGDEHALATPICFEDTVGWLCRRMVFPPGGPKAALVVNLSNDGWFGDSDAGRARHVQIARFRCVENRVPMIRCANTGMSVAIDPAGKVVATIGDGRYGEGRREGWLAVALDLDPRTTLYARVGEVCPWTCLGLAVALVGNDPAPESG